MPSALGSEDPSDISMLHQPANPDTVQDYESLKTKVSNLITVKNKPRVLLAVHQPAKPSQQQQPSGGPIFHWSVLIVPKISLGCDCHKFDLTDSNPFYPASRAETSAPGWRFRHETVDPTTLPDLLALGVLGKLDGRAMADPGEVPRILRDIALPNPAKGEDSRSWAKAGVWTLHHDGIFGRKRMDLDRVFRAMSEEAGRRVAGGEKGVEVVQLSSRRCDVYFPREGRAG